MVRGEERRGKGGEGTEGRKVRDGRGRVLRGKQGKEKGREVN